MRMHRQRHQTQVLTVRWLWQTLLAAPSATHCRRAARRRFTSHIHAAPQPDHSRDHAADADLLDPIASRWSATHAAQLKQYGFTVIDDAISDSLATALRAETSTLYENGLMIPNHTHLVHRATGAADSYRSLVAKHGIHESEADIAGIDAVIPYYCRLMTDTSLMTAMNQSFQQLALPLTLSSQRIKIQYNEGNGSCFPLHFDSEARIDGRRVTAILYLNRQWREDDCGELKLYPLPYQPVTIAPVWRRAVVFASSTLLHRVLPSKRERACVTLWMSTDTLAPVSTQSAASASAMDGADPVLLSALRTLLHPRYYQHAAKLAYADEWAQSILQSHPDTDDARQMIEQHRSDVSVIERALKPYTLCLPANLLPLSLPSELTTLDQVHTDHSRVRIGESNGEEALTADRLRRAVESLQSFL